MSDLAGFDESSRAEATESAADTRGATERCEPPRSLSRASGPRTPEGKATARANAVQHGLSASTLLPQILQPGRVDFYRQQLTTELHPQTTLEQVLVDEFARHAAMLEFSERAEGAVLRKGARELSQLLGVCDAGAPVDEDSTLSAAVASKTLDLFTRYRRGHEKALFAAVNALRELRVSRTHRPLEAAKQDGVGFHFGSEIACETFLKKRFDRRSWRCPRCASADGNWLPSRRRWECAGCRRQTGLRIGTVMERSPIELVKWFAAIEYVLCNQHPTAAELGQRIHIDRAATVRRLLAKILAALQQVNASELVAGLDGYFGYTHVS